MPREDCTPLEKASRRHFVRFLDARSARCATAARYRAIAMLLTLSPPPAAGAAPLSPAPLPRADVTSYAIRRYGITREDSLPSCAGGCRAPRALRHTDAAMPPRARRETPFTMACMVLFAGRALMRLKAYFSSRTAARQEAFPRAMRAGRDGIAAVISSAPVDKLALLDAGGMTWPLPR